MSAHELLAALKAENDRRAKRIRRNWILLGSALACVGGFSALVAVMIGLDWTPWWLMTIAFVLAVTALACVRLTDGAR